MVFSALMALRSPNSFFPVVKAIDYESQSGIFFSRLVWQGKLELISLNKASRTEYCLFILIIASTKEMKKS